MNEPPPPAPAASKAGGPPEAPPPDSGSLDAELPDSWPVLPAGGLEPGPDPGAPLTAGPEAIPPPADAEFVAPSLEATSVFLEKQPSEAEQHSAAAIYARRYFMGKPHCRKD
ncbi:MAG: hypothetical protein NT168_07680 [Planctomycetota bacterium]|nr:hypothetical protein [Planctomycetota bacterium]